MEKQERDFKGIWIPKEIWLAEDLTLIEKIFLIEIDSLNNESGCFASNSYFSEFFNISKGRCTQVIKSLESKNRIKIELERKGKQITKRTLRVVNFLNTPSKNIKHPYLENDDVNNTSSNNTKDNNTLFITTSEEVGCSFASTSMIKEEYNVVDIKDFENKDRFIGRLRVINGSLEFKDLCDASKLIVEAFYEVWGIPHRVINKDVEYDQMCDVYDNEGILDEMIKSVRKYEAGKITRQVAMNRCTINYFGDSKRENIYK